MKSIHKYQNFNTSKEYYLNLKNKNNDLNLSENKLNKTEAYLSVFLEKSYAILNPIFNDNDIVELEKENSLRHSIDEEFDNTILESLPKWIKKVIQIIQVIFFNPIKNLGLIMVVVIKATLNKLKQTFFALLITLKRKCVALTKVYTNFKARPT